MISITSPTNPKMLQAILATDFKSLKVFNFHVKMALHIQPFKVYRLMVENCVREFREKRKLTQSELAEAIQVSRQTIHSIENHNAVPTVEIAIRMAQVMKTKVETLFRFSKGKLKS